MAEKRKTREVVAGIIEFRSRNLDGAPRAALSRRRRSIKESFKSAKSGPPELLRYFPVALVASVEWLLRASVAELIDYGPPYSDRAVNLQDRPIDIETLAAIHGKKVSFGEIVAHMLPVSRIEHVDGCMSRLLGTPFKAVISNVKDRHLTDLVGDDIPPIIDDVNETYKYVEKTFELRHIYCHEAAQDNFPSGELIEKCIFHSDKFLDAMDWAVSDIVTPDMGFSTVGMVDVEERARQKAQEQLELAISEIKATGDDKVYNAFLISQAAWERFRNAEATVAAAEYDGGSFASVAYAKVLKRLTQERASAVKEFSDNMLFNML